MHLMLLRHLTQNIHRTEFLVNRSLVDVVGSAMRSGESVKVHLVLQNVLIFKSIDKYLLKV